MTEKAPARVWDIPCQHCGHVTLRYHGPDLPKPTDSNARLVSRLRYLDGTRPKDSDVAECTECGETLSAETLDAKNWQEYKDYDPDMKRLPTHGHKGDSPFKKAG